MERERGRWSVRWRGKEGLDIEVNREGKREKNGERERGRE
jgi:hypothetical protein